MALWKPFRGNRAGLDKVEKHDGYVYFCIDDGSLFFDYTDADGNLHRKQINAKDAETLLGHSIEEFLIASENGSFAHGEGAVAIGTNSYAGGQEVLAFGNAAHVEGKGARAGDYSVEILGQQVSLTTLNLTIASADATNRTVTTSTTVIPKDNLTSLLSQLSTGRLVLKLAPSGTENYVYLPVDGYTIEVKDNILVDYSYLVLNVSDAYDETTNPALTSLVGYGLKDMCLGVAYGEAAHIEGYGNITYADYAHVEGKLTVAEGEASHTEGTRTIASGEASHAEGASTRALGNYTHAEGHGTKATADDSHAEGIGAIASGIGSHAEGYYTEASHEYAHVEGRAAVASGKISHAEGHATVASGSVSHAEGNTTTASGSNSHAEGHSTVAEGETSHAEGVGTRAQGKGAHAEGESTTASANRAHAEGYGTSASELNAHAEGKLTIASAEEAHAEGISTIASGAYSHTEGNTTQALSEAAHAEGKETIAQGIGAHAEGSKSKALNNTAHAEGSNTEASGDKSHAEGNSTKATGTASHAEGDKTEAKGYASHAGGQNSIASNAGSFVHGTGLKTNSNNQAVVGAYNKTYEQAAAFIVGNGKEDARSNALAVMKNGDTYVKGNLYVGGTPEGDEGTGIAKVATEGEAHLYAETVANSAAERVKNELLNGAGDAYDTLKELGDLIDENKDAFEVVTDLVNNKADQNDVSNAFKKTVSTTEGGQFLTITDHSPVPHMMRLIGKHNLYSSEVHQYGKNILNMESFLGGALVQKEDGTYDLRYSNGNTYVSAWNHQYIPPETVITISLEVLDYVDIADGNLKLQIQTSGGNHWLDFPVSIIGRQSKTITTKGNVNQMQFMIASSNGKSAGIVFKEPQFELGATATEYVAYQTAYYDAPATGVDVPAFYPVTTFITDWGLIDCTYNQDINNIFDDTNYMSATDPVGTGSFSMNRKAGTTVGVYSHAEGNNTTASGRSSHAEGNSTTASNIGAHAEGSMTVASGLDSHAEGQNTTASGQDAHAEGYYTFAEELGAHAGGLYSHAKTKGSFVHGRYLNATAVSQFVVGEYNREDPDALFIVGGGESEGNRKNLFAVKKDGSITGLNTSNALTKTVSGEAIAIRDASPIEHEMNVKVHKKNYLDISKLAPVYNGTLAIDGNKLTVTTSTQEFPGGYYEIRDPALFGKTVTLSCSYEILEKAEGDETYKQCYASVELNVRNKQGAKVFSTSIYGARVPSATKSRTVTLPEYEDGLYIGIGVYAVNKLDGSAMEEGRQIVYSNLQLEEGTVATAYTPYIEDISTAKVKKYGKNIVDIDSSLNSVFTKEDIIYTITRTSNSHISNGITLRIPANTPITWSAELLEYTGTYSTYVRIEI